MNAPPRVGLVALDDVVFHPHNVRRDLGDLRSLAESIRRYGVMQPVVVENHDGWLRLRAGHRRTAAARLAGLKRIPAVIHSQALDDEDWLVASIHENTRRRDLDHVERARAANRLRELGCTWQGIGEAFGVTAGTAAAWVNAPSLASLHERMSAEAATRAEKIAAATREGLSARVVADRVGVTPRTVVRHRTGARTVTTRSLRSFVDAWRAAPGATTSDILDALAKVADTARITEAMPPRAGESRVG